MENISFTLEPELCTGVMCPLQPDEYKALEGHVVPGTTIGEEVNPFTDQLESFLMSSVLPTGANQTLHWQEIVNILQETNQKSYLGTAAKVSLITIYSLLITVGILGNLIVAFVIGHRPELRTARNVYIVNLTVSDVSMCLVCMPFTLVGLLHKNWSLGNLICKLVPVLQCTNILVSTATIVAIAADRYLTIVCVKRSKDPRAYIPWSVAAIWLVSLVFPLPLFAYYFVKKVQIKDYLLYEKCMESWSSPVVKYTWNITLIVMQYIIPILVLSFVHGRIHNYLSSHKMSQRDARRAQREIERNRRTTILLTSIAVTFAICWLPWHVVNLLADFNYAGFQEPEYFYMVFGSCHAVAMSSACINPILYGWLNTNLRKEMTQALPILLRKTSCPVRRSGNTLSSVSAKRPTVESVSLLVHRPERDDARRGKAGGTGEMMSGRETTPAAEAAKENHLTGTPFLRIESATMEEVTEQIHDET
nr:neuropeptide Y receptor type 6-like [Cherax quadricarinatus]XP_053639902.1 neuropeptide Y receptor type 6-like [Cherax quadricarinatus]XP_053639903.1 neuropeptide Y receptor type 6-like [Cherax quadricarinatus]XP_053639904.1 neuropeptide Y receptor type 6-like [Cherax quadricarinatus]